MKNARGETLPGHWLPRLRGEAAETLRKMLVSPAVNLSPLLAQHIRTLRDLLILPIPERIAEAARQPSLRPVE